MLGCDLVKKEFSSDFLSAVVAYDASPDNLAAYRVFFDEVFLSLTLCEIFLFIRVVCRLKEIVYFLFFFVFVDGNARLFPHRLFLGDFGSKRLFMACNRFDSRLNTSAQNLDSITEPQIWATTFPFRQCFVSSFGFVLITCKVLVNVRRSSNLEHLDVFLDLLDSLIGT